MSGLPLGADDPLRLRAHRARGCASAPARPTPASPSPARTRSASARPRRRAARTCTRSRSSRSTRASASRSSSRGSRRTQQVPEAIDPEQALADTEGFWREWSEACPLDLPADWAPLVRRSLIVLKALTYDADGRHRRRADDLAARVDRLRAQLGLPLLLAARRDAHAARPAPLQPRRRGGGVAALAPPGDRGRPGRRPDHVRRRRRAAPDRVRAAVARRLRGLAAGARRQRGERAAPARRLRRGDRRALPGAPARPRRSTRRRGRSSSALLDHLEDAWREPDDGIWEIRGERRHFVHSKAMAWVAFDRAVRTVEDARLRGPGRPLARGARRDPPRGLRARLRRRSSARSRSRTARRSSTRASCCCRSSASCRPPTRASADDRGGRAGAPPRRLRAPLPHQRGPRADGLPPGEGVFLPCSFWLCDCYELLGRHDEAHALFERLARARERPRPAVGGVRPRAGRLLGNFPQAFTHLALVNTAFNLAPHLPSPMHRRHATRH